MSRHKHPALERRQDIAGRFSFQLSLRGIAGIGVVLFCLFLWMFLLGIWAGQTILFPQHPPQPLPHPIAAEPPAEKIEAAEPISISPSLSEPLPEHAVQTLLPLAKKKRIGQPGFSAAEDASDHQPDITEE